MTVAFAGSRDDTANDLKFDPATLSRSMRKAIDRLATAPKGSKAGKWGKPSYELHVRPAAKYCTHCRREYRNYDHGNKASGERNLLCRAQPQRAWGQR